MTRALILATCVLLLCGCSRTTKILVTAPDGTKTEITKGWLDEAKLGTNPPVVIGTSKNVTDAGVQVFTTAGEQVQRYLIDKGAAAATTAAQPQPEHPP